MCLLAICMCSLESYLGLLPVFLIYLVFLMLSSTSFFDILETNPLSIASFANIFTHSEDYLFVLFRVSFAVQKLLSLIRSHLFIFVSTFITLGGGLKKIFW